MLALLRKYCPCKFKNWTGLPNKEESVEERRTDLKSQNDIIFSQKNIDSKKIKKTDESKTSRFVEKKNKVYEMVENIVEEIIPLSRKLIGENILFGRKFIFTEFKAILKHFYEGYTNGYKYIISFLEYSDKWVV